MESQSKEHAESKANKKRTKLATPEITGAP